MKYRETLQKLASKLEHHGYFADQRITLSIHLSMELGKPLLIEGPAGVGKTEIAKVMSSLLKTNLIRMQCYEGLEAAHALYEWNYQRQLLQLKIEESNNKSVREKEDSIFSERFLMKRPLLNAITQDVKPVLLIDEIDRADEEFESFLMEILSDWQVTIPEMGTITASSIPFVVVTSNRTRDLSEALRRRCLYLWIDYPDFEKELAIVRRKVPGIDHTLGEQICSFMQEVRKMKLDKVPGIAETIDWATALASMHFDFLDKQIVEETLGVILKDWSDLRQVQMSLSELYDRVGVINKLG